jgi:two-component system, chemotaxis family, response regulator Rcp1
MPTSLDLLLVEDNEGDVELTKRALRDITPACTLGVANDGLEAMDFLMKRGRFPDAADPDFILLDLNMPKMDGKRFLELVKEDTKLKAIPVIMFTSSQSPVDIRDCYERHASCYVVKPFDGKEFTNTVRQVVNFWGSVGQLP